MSDFRTGPVGKPTEADKRTPVMRNRIHRVALLLCLLVAFRNAAAVTADEIVAKNVEARGGAGALAALKSLRRTGRFILPGRAPGPASTKSRRPTGRFSRAGPSLLVPFSGVRERPGRLGGGATRQGLTQ